MAATSEQPESVPQVTNPVGPPTIPGYVPVEMYEDLQKQIVDLKSQLELSVPLKLYQDLMEENIALKKAKKKAEVERNGFKFRSESYVRKLRSLKNGDNLTKKAKHQVCHELLDKKLGEATIDCLIKNQKKSYKFSTKGILHML